ncbi:MAG: thioredoxin family protein [Alphaproteobacteria bacterium]
MPALEPPLCDFGWKAKDFSLPGTDGHTYSLKDVRGAKGTLVAFICNHCPYVKAIAPRLAATAKELQAMGVGVIAIMPNDVAAYPEDSFPRMKEFAALHRFTFPYVIDEDQTVARAYAAVCTPDFFGFNAADELQYRGRLDESKTSPTAGARRELLEAMREIAQTGKGPKDQKPSIGCSIKWRE